MSDKPCVEPGCNEPRMRGPRSGRLLSRCVKHQRAYDRKAKEAKRRAQGVKPRTKQASKRGRKPKQGQRKLLLLDYERDMVQRLTLVEIEQVPMASLRRGQPHPHTVGIYIHMGYQVAEIRSEAMQAEIVTLQRRIDCARYYLERRVDCEADTLRQILTGQLTMQDIKAGEMALDTRLQAIGE